tara:strand:+ start:465 stop:1193 length:729 start_codon:yes stop_codon:yes gene_type:complete
MIAESVETNTPNTHRVKIESELHRNMQRGRCERFPRLIHQVINKVTELIVKVQENADLFNMYAKSMGYSIAKFIENYIAVSVLQAATGNDVTLSADNTFTTALLRSALQKFLDAGHSYTDGDAFLYCSPASYMSALSLQDFYDASRRGDGVGPVASGSVGMVYGVPTFVSTDWDDDGGTGDETASLFKREAVYFAQQISPRVQSSYDIDYLSTSIVADVVFGACLSHGASSTSCAVANFNNP